MDYSKIFARKSDENIQKISEIDMAEVADILGLYFRNDGAWGFDFFNRKIYFLYPDFTDAGKEEVTDAVKTILTAYVLTCPRTIAETNNKLISFREFDNAGPLLSSFTTNTGKIIETAYSGRLEQLIEQSIKLGGKLIETPGFDLGVRFKALRHVAIILRFNDKYEGMPATASFLFHENAVKWVDLQSLMLMATYLTGQLIS